MKIFCIVLLLFSASVCHADLALLSLITSNEELVVLAINFAGNKYTITDRAVFPLSATGGLTALAPLANGNYQVAWTQKDASGKIKVYSREITETLDAVGGEKKNNLTLSSYYNLNILPDGEYFSVDLKNKVTIRTRTASGGLGSGSQKPFNLPASFDPFNTSFADINPVARASALSDPVYSCSLVYNPEFGYGVVFNDDFESGDEVLFTFSSAVVDAFCQEDFDEAKLWFIYIEAVFDVGRNGKAVSTLALKRRKLEGDGTFAPIGSIATLVPPKPADLIADSVPFFNMFALATPKLTASAKNKAATVPTADVFYLEQVSSCNSTALKAFRFNNKTGKKSSPFSTLISCNDSLLSEPTFFYGLAALGI